MRYALSEEASERRDPEFESKMAAVLHVYKEVEILNEGLLRGDATWRVGRNAFSSSSFPSTAPG
jgi:hypothetical protein